MHVCLGKKSSPFWMKENGNLNDVLTQIFNKLSTCGTTSVAKLICALIFLWVPTAVFFFVTYSVLLDFVGTKKRYKDNNSS